MNQGKEEELSACFLEDATPSSRSILQFPIMKIQNIVGSNHILNCSAAYIGYWITPPGTTDIGLAGLGSCIG